MERKLDGMDYAAWWNALRKSAAELKRERKRHRNLALVRLGGFRWFERMPEVSNG